MSRFAIARARLASALLITTAIALSAGSASARGDADDASALARALLSRPFVALGQDVASGNTATTTDPQDSARRLLGGHRAPAANRSPATPMSTMTSEDGSTADASDAARRMIVGKGS